jgi:hypothetical protein
VVAAAAQNRLALKRLGTRIEFRLSDLEVFMIVSPNAMKTGFLD